MSSAASRLSLAALPALGDLAPAYDVARAEVGVVHLGPGAFFRAHQAPVYERLLAGGDRRWGVCGVSLRSADLRDALAPQDGLYTLVRLGEAEPPQVIGALRERLVAPKAPGAVRARLEAATTRLVTLTVTEKGYHLDAAGGLNGHDAAVAHELAGGAPPRTVYGWLAPALARRAAEGGALPLLLSCDNLPANGSRLKRALFRFIAAGGDAALADGLERDLLAPDAMVDSITPATDPALRRRVCDVLGVEDAWPVQREPFAQWVVGRADHPALEALAGAGVTVTGDVAGYEAAKLTLLNGAHSTLAYLGLLGGCETVAEAMGDPRLAGFVEALMRRDLLPTVRPPPELDLDAYVDAILARFRNGAVRHRLMQIAADGSQKLPLRIGRAALAAVRGGAPLERLATPFAAWWLWVERRVGAGHALDDPLAACLEQAATTGADGLALVAPELAQAPGLRAAYLRALETLRGPDPLSRLPTA